MKLRLNIRPLEFAVACLLTLALLLPTVLQFNHIFETHEHIACSEAKSHIHEAPVDCSFQEYQISSFTFDPIAYFEVITIINNDSREIVSLQHFHTTLLHSNSLRGPPVYLI